MKTPCLYRGKEIVANVDGRNVHRCVIFVHCVIEHKGSGIAACENCGNYIQGAPHEKNRQQNRNQLHV